MLIEYNFENFKSFKGMNTFSMVGVPSFKEHEPDNIISMEKFKLLKSAVIYGNNASGKSNFTDGIAAMKKLVLNSFRDALLEEDNDSDSERSITVDKFLLSTDSEDQPTHFEIKFLCCKAKFRYGFEILNGQISSEWLYSTQKIKEVPLFVREGKKFSINKSSFGEGENLEKKTRSNVLFLSLVAQLNGKKSSSIIDWFKQLNLISGLMDEGYGGYTLFKLRQDVEFRKWVSLILPTLEISNITVDELEGKSDNKKKQIKFQVSTWHNKYDSQNIIVDSVPFDFASQESEGTKRFIFLLGPIYDTLRNGKILLIDEFDSRLHPHLLQKLTEMFHRTNKFNSQLIYTSHHASLLDKDLFRRDQIWFSEKDQFGISSMYSLADFKSTDVRNTSSFSKNYLKGKYGAISYFDIKDELINELYENV
ncbi:MAG: ATP-binding protein [Candidatus Marinimicrobia bacterium]|nr:ATP-binding protein [Candidatus Neomarinimicrobiota bacterium]